MWKADNSQTTEMQEWHDAENSRPSTLTKVHRVVRAGGEGGINIQKLFDFSKLNGIANALMNFGAKYIFPSHKLFTL